MNPAPAEVLGEVTYTTAYLGVGVNGSGESDGSTPQAATGTPLQWTADTLRSLKAWSTGELGNLKAWTALLPTGIMAENTIALKRFGAAVVYDIPDSAPGFTGTGNWPEYLGTNPLVSWPQAADPDGHTIWYRYKTVSGEGEWISESSAGTLPEAEWSLHLAGGGTVYLQAWAGEAEQPDWTAAIAEVSHTYDAAHIDFTAPAVTAGGIWKSPPAWSNAASFELTAGDSESGLESVTVLLTPADEDGSEDTASGRPAVTPTPGSFTAGTAHAVIPVPLDTTMSGLYRLTITVTDRAGNQTLSASQLARFDYEPPAVENVWVTNPYDSADSCYYADALGTISAILAAGDMESGLAGWGWQLEGGEWQWNTWYGPDVTLAPDWSGAEPLRVRFAVRDRAGNESPATAWENIGYDRTLPEFSLTVEGTTGADNNYVRDLNTLFATVTPAGLNVEWSLVQQEEDGTEQVTAGKASWLEVIEDESLWQEGGEYRIRAKVTTRSGIAGIKESRAFTLDSTAPSAVTIGLAAPADSGRTTYYRNEPLLVTWQGGEDAQTPVKREIRLYQQTGNEQRELNRVSAGSGGTQLNWGTTDIAWEEGGFYVQGTATNSAGAETVSAAVAVPVGGEGLIVYLPPYNRGTGEIALSWNAGPLAGITSYKYQFRLQGGTDLRLGTETETGADNVLVDLTSYGLVEGERIYATVQAYDETGTLVAKGVSSVSVTDTGTPVIEWTAVPRGVTSSRIWARFRMSGTASGMAGAKWLIEKREPGAEWTVVVCNDQTDWRPAAGNELAADLTGKVSTGDLVRLTVLAEKTAGKAVQASTGALPVDDTPPPVPLVLDQGQVINHTKQVLNFNWQLSANDPESGTESWYYGWFYRGESVEPEQWHKLTEGEWQAEADLKSAGGAELDGKTVVFAVKAVNAAGLITTGYSDGILLDSTAPLIYAMKVYTDNSRSRELAGYVEEAAFSGNSVYLEIEAQDNQSWLDGGSLYASRWNEPEGRWEPVGEAVEFPGNGAEYTLPGGESWEAGSLWRFESEAADAAGNISGRAMSSGFVVEGEVPYVTRTRCRLDTTYATLSWDVSAEADVRWINHYAVTALWGTETRTILTQARTASFIWGAGGLELKTGDTVQFTVSAISCTGAVRHAQSSADYQVTVTIDASPPVFDEEQTEVPRTRRAHYWYDRLEGHLVYQADLGVSSLQWSAVLVPGELPLTDWQEKRWAEQWDFTQLLSSLSPEELSTWHGKQIRLKFRAANAMGIWSEVTLLPAVTVDTTEPETAALARESAWSNETGTVTGWTLQLEDKQSGILEYMTLLVPAEQVNGGAAAYSWPDTAPVYEVTDSSPETLTTLNIAIELSEGREGSFVPLVRVRNGTGHWSVRAGEAITIDRTSPVAEVVWPGTFVQTLVTDGTLRIWQVSNGPRQEVEITTDEPVQCEITGSWLSQLNLPLAGYAQELKATLDYGANPEGRLYPVTIDLEDQAGNHAVVQTVLRYNRAPLVTINTAALTLRPGLPVQLEELVSLEDEEENRPGDYPLTIVWQPGGGSVEQEWTGGGTRSNVFGAGSEPVSYLQSEAAAQRTGYTGTLTVTDRYHKARTVELELVVENSRAGTLLVNEYWSGPFEIRGVVTVPAGKRLSIRAADITVKANLVKGVMAGGIRIEPGGELLIDPGAEDLSHITTFMEGVYWQGIRVEGGLSGSGLEISWAERALVLTAGGRIELSDYSLTSNLTGAHLLGGTLTLANGTIGANSEYGIKEDSEGNYSVRISTFKNNGENYYRHQVSRITVEEINALEGNGGNKEEK